MEDFRYNFCRLCKNRKHDLKKGIYCGLISQKPNFIGSCENYDEDKEKRRMEDARLFHEGISDVRFLKYNRYNANKWLIKKIRAYLPDKFPIKTFSFDIYSLAPILLTVSLFVAMFVEIPIAYKLPSSILILVLLILASFKNWKSLVKEAEKVAIIDKVGVELISHSKTQWEEIKFVYIHSRMFKSYLCFELRNEKGPIYINLEGTLGGFILLNIIECYRGKV